MLAFNWGDLTYKEQRYFNNDEALFLKKKSLMIENSRIYSKMKSIHEKMKLSNYEAKRQEYAEELVSLDEQRYDNWQEIDTF